MKISADILIDRPVSDVFNFVADNHHANHSRWDPRVVRLEPLEPGPPALGTSFRITRKLMGREEMHTFRYIEWQPLQAMSYQSDGGTMPFVFRSRFEALSPDRTRLALTGEARPRGPRALLAPVLRPMFTRQVRGNLARIKAFVECAE